MTVERHNKLEKSPEKKIGGDQGDELNSATVNVEIDSKLSSEQRRGGQNSEPETSTSETTAKAPHKELAEQHSKTWQSVPKPKGHTALNYARWDRIDDDSSDDEDDDEDEEESQPQYRFRVKTIGVRSVK